MTCAAVHHADEYTLRCGLESGHDGAHMAPGGLVEWSLTDAGAEHEAELGRRWEYLARREVVAARDQQYADSQAAKKAADEHTEAIRSRRVALGAQVIKHLGRSLEFVRGPDTVDERHNTVTRQRVHVLMNGRTACKPQLPRDYLTVKGPDAEHPLCQSCAHAFGAHGEALVRD